MSINLEKGHKISLEKEASGSKHFFVGLGWDVGFFSSSVDLDASCVLLDVNKNVIDTVYFGKKIGINESVKHSGDNLTGVGKGDDEVIKVFLDKMPESVTDVVFCVTSYRGQTFKKIKNAFCRFVESDSNKEIARYNLSDMEDKTALIFGRIYKHNSEWKAMGLGQFCNGGTVSSIISDIKNSY